MIYTLNPTNRTLNNLKTYNYQHARLEDSKIIRDKIDALIFPHQDQ